MRVHVRVRVCFCVLSLSALLGLRGFVPLFPAPQSCQWPGIVSSWVCALCAVGGDNGSVGKEFVFMGPVETWPRIGTK